jgi:protease-4
MKSFLRTLVAVVIGQVLLVLIVGGVIAVKMKEKPKVKAGSVLVQVLDGAVPESAPAGGLPFPGATGTSQTALLENLEKARHDARIRAVVLRVGAPEVGWAKMNELRQRIAQIRSAGKPVWAYTEGLTSRSLYLGGACDSLFLLRNGYTSLHGIGGGMPFIAGTLEKLGIRQNIHRIEHYKSAAEMVQRTELSPESRANREWMLDAYYPELVQTIERERRLAPGTLEGVFRAGALAPREAREFGLVDRLVYWDEVEAALLRVPGVRPEKKAEAGAPATPRHVSGDDYAQIERREAGIKAKKKIAVVHATGMIGGEESGVNFPLGATMGAATMDRAFRAAAEDKGIAAIIFRVDSGGGESTTSWRIQRSALRAKARKPMVVSMGDVAGSGGYLICYPCGTLIANPLSVVGSIGSISGKMNLRGLYDKLGISWDFVTRGPNALMESDYFDYTPEQWAAFTANHWADYQEWVDDIARVRGKTSAEIDSLGRGRVWTGAQALERGLIDRVGTFDDAVALAKEQAGIPKDQEVEFVHYPRKQGVLEALRSGGMAAALFTLVDQVVAPFRHEGTWAVDWNAYR